MTLFFLFFSLSLLADRTVSSMQAHEVCKTNISEAQYLALVLIDGVLSGSLSMWKYVLRGDDCTTCSPTDLPQNKMTKFFEKKK